MQENYLTEFKKIYRAINEKKKVLLIAHPRPDGDTIGSVFALKEIIRGLNKFVKVICPDPMPSYLKEFIKEDFDDYREIDTKNFDILIGCDAVERGFEQFVQEKLKNQKIILLDHHTSVALQKIKADVIINDEKYSSVCEIIYDFMDTCRIPMNKKIATLLLLGILNDTGLYQHANTTSRVLEISSFLMRKGAPLYKIVRLNFKNRKIETLKLWGRALERAKINKKTGAIISYLTRSDLEELNANKEDIGFVADILNTVPGTKFSIVLSEQEPDKIKASLRSDQFKNFDVSKIAKIFRGGGHRLASGFVIKGKIIKNKNGCWAIK